MQLRSALRTITILMTCSGIMVSCAKAWHSTQDDIQGRFELKGRRYILSPDKPGVIYDDAVRYTAGAGARTFYYADEYLIRHLFVGRRANFGSLTLQEQQETTDIANAALELIKNTGNRDQDPSNMNQLHRRILTAFLARAR